VEIETPFYLIDEARMIKYLKRIGYVRRKSGAKSLLALKCFSVWSLFELMKKYMYGTTSSSLYEARLGHEEFGGETHGYCVAYSKKEIQEIFRYCDKIIFTSVSQLKMYKNMTGRIPVGLRVNPQTGFSRHIASDSVGRFSRLGSLKSSLSEDICKEISGMMFHYNCDNENFERFASDLSIIEKEFGYFLKRVEWVSLGGGVAFTSDGYPLDAFCDLLKKFSEKFEVQVYLEPGEAAVTRSASLAVTVLDIVHNEREIIVVDAGTEPHLPDVLTYGYAPELQEGEILARSDCEEFEDQDDGYIYMVCGRTCLAADIFGTYKFDRKIEAGNRLHFSDAGGYSMVKKNWFNGIRMPAIVHKKLDGTEKVVQFSTYEDFKG